MALCPHFRLGFKQRLLPGAHDAPASIRRVSIGTVVTHSAHPEGTSIGFEDVVEMLKNKRRKNRRPAPDMDTLPVSLESDTQPPKAFAESEAVPSVKSGGSAGLNDDTKEVQRRTGVKGLGVRAPRADQARSSFTSTQRAQHSNENKSLAPRVQDSQEMPRRVSWVSSGPTNRRLRGLFEPSHKPNLPCFERTVVIVEGRNDQLAVHRAVNARVFVAQGASGYSDTSVAQLRELRALRNELMVLTDSDDPGRRLRNFIDEALGRPLLHAFVLAHDSTSTSDTKNHEEGNIGIEHASPAAIHSALTHAQPSFGSQRKIFTRELLLRRGLANEFDADVPQASATVAQRRRRLCSLLGYGSANGKALMVCLNRYCVVQQFEAAMKVVDKELPLGGAPLA